MHSYFLLSIEAVFLDFYHFKCGKGDVCILVDNSYQLYINPILNMFIFPFRSLFFEMTNRRYAKTLVVWRSLFLFAVSFFVAKCS